MIALCLNGNATSCLLSQIAFVWFLPTLQLSVSVAAPPLHRWVLHLSQKNIRWVMSSLLCFVLNLSWIMDYIKPPFRRQFRHSSSWEFLLSYKFIAGSITADTEFTAHCKFGRKGKWGWNCTVALRPARLTGRIHWGVKDRATLGGNRSFRECSPAGSNLTCKARGRMWNLFTWSKGSGVNLCPVWDWGVHSVPSRGAPWNHLGSSE